MEKQVVGKDEQGAIGRKVGVQKPKLRGRVFVGGDFHVEGPAILKRLSEEGKVVFNEDGTGIEFCLYVKNGGQKDGLGKTSPYIDLSEADIEISAEDECEEAIEDNFNLHFKGPEGREFDLTVSIGQAWTISRLLSNYVQAHDLWKTFKAATIAPGIH